MAAKEDKKKNPGKKPALKKRRRHDETVKEYLSDHTTAKSFS
jgi:hypothetical protein